MPLVDLRCEACEYEITDRLVARTPDGDPKRVIIFCPKCELVCMENVRPHRGTSFRLKGAGFHANDYP